MESRLIWRSAMSTKMTQKDWVVALEVFRASLPRRGDKGRDDRLFLEAMHYFSLHNISWRALPERFGKWNSVWRRFDRLSKAGVFETFFDHLASLSSSAHLVQIFSSTIVRAHVSAARAKGGRRVDPPPLNGSTLKYGFDHEGGPQWPTSDTSPTRSSRSFGRLRFCAAKAWRWRMPFARSAFPN